MEIKPRLAEFSDEIIPIKEIESFYTLHDVALPLDRPYIWVKENIEIKA